jgi:nucleoside-triphosphatase THEP1
MVYIITGAINEGKTQKMVSLYNQLNKGDGFVSKKIFNRDKNFAGYEIERLSTKEKLPLAYKQGYVPTGWDEIFRIGPFRFSKAAVAFAENIIDDIIRRGIEPVFIDEIGPLELQGQGFSAILTKTLNAQKDVYISVRSFCVEDVKKKFKIENPISLPL